MDEPHDPPAEKKTPDAGEEREVALAPEPAPHAALVYAELVGTWLLFVVLVALTGSSSAEPGDPGAYVNYDGFVTVDGPLLKLAPLGATLAMALSYQAYRVARRVGRWWSVPTAQGRPHLGLRLAALGAGVTMPLVSLMGLLMALRCVVYALTGPSGMPVQSEFVVP